MADMVKMARWTALATAAKKYAAEASKENAQALSDAAKAWVQEPGEQSAKPKSVAHDGVVIPFGRSKGTPIGQADTKDLMWVADALRKSIDDPAKERWVDSNRTLLGAIEFELETR